MAQHAQELRFVLRGLHGLALRCLGLVTQGVGGCTGRTFPSGHAHPVSDQPGSQGTQATAKEHHPLNLAPKGLHGLLGRIR